MTAYASEARARYARNSRDPEFRRMRHSAVLMGRYGITADDLDRMIEAQGNRCAICDRHVDDVHRDGRGLHVDHDHLLAERGAGAEAVRGLLCFGCNTTVGRLLDDPEVAHRFAAYLQASEAKRTAYGL